MIPRRDYSDFDCISAPIFVLEVNDEGLPVYAAFNSFARQTSGRPLSDYIGRTAQEVYPQAFGRTAFAHHCDVLKKGVATSYQLDLPLGSATRTVRTTLRPEHNAAGDVVRLFGTSRDMHSEKQAMEAKVEFDTMSAEMEQFVALAAHDLRAPMRHISAVADMMRDDLETSGNSKHELLDMIESIAMKTMDLISDVLAHAEISQCESVESVFSFPALCQDMCAVLDPLSAHNFTTSTATIKADKTALQIALRNLIENALKHGGRDVLNIDISVQDGVPGMVEFTLTDDGQGFTDAALKAMNGGRLKMDNGYGLFGVKRLISARKGIFYARNLPDGSGAVVRFSLPGARLGGATALDIGTQTRQSRVS